MLWLNEKHIEEGLYHKNVWMTTVKHLSDHRKHRYELVEEPTKQQFYPQRISNQINHQKMKYVFYFIEKALFVLKIFKFL